MKFDTVGGAKFVKADLHVHSPGSHDYQDDASPEDLIEAFEDKGLELVAITDHNCNIWYDKIAEAAERSSVTVLPGVEITTGQSGEHQIHVTAIFPPESASNINYVLGQVGINPETPEHEISESTIPVICDKVREHNGLPILAHIDRNAGAHVEIPRNNPSKQSAFDTEKVAALEIMEDDDLREHYSEFAHIRSSDAHSLDQIGTRHTYLKMTEPSFDGLRTALSDPGSRITLDESPSTHSSIDGIQVDGGFLQNRTLQLNKNLNCLIGGKGTGKSTLIEHIRYVLDVEPRSERIIEEYQRLIEQNLGVDGTIKLYLTATNGHQYLIERAYLDEPVVKRIEQGKSEEDVVYRELEIEIDTFRERFLDVEIHSQRELIELARDEVDQLKLFDLYFDVESQHAAIDDIKGQLREKSRELEDAKEKSSELEGEKQQFQALKEQVSVMEERGVEEYVENDDAWQRERQQLKQAVTSIQDASGEAAELDIAASISTLDIEDETPNPKIVTQADSLVAELQTTVAEFEEQIQQELEKKLEEIKVIEDKWKGENSEREEQFKELADKIQEQIEVDIENFFEKKQELEDLRGVEEDYEEAIDQVEDLEAKREELFAKLDQAREDLTTARQQGIRKLNTQLNDVKVSLEHAANRDEYKDWVDKVLRGSNVLTTDKEEVAEVFDPKEFAKLVRQHNIEPLITQAGITKTAAENIMGHAELQERVYELEILDIHDGPTIEINDGGWKSLQSMSDGQQCTALLSIAMVERDVPLIIDQPEDMLDNEFIYSEVVEIIRGIKHNRQLIAATHNANIPVLGDAEQIIVMNSNGRRGFYRKCGSIDAPEVKKLAQNILEGGMEAFRLRNEKYLTSP